jgi:hypothetical protein
MQSVNFTHNSVIFFGFRVVLPDVGPIELAQVREVESLGRGVPRSYFVRGQCTILTAHSSLVREIHTCNSLLSYL